MVICLFWHKSFSQESQENGQFFLVEQGTRSSGSGKGLGWGLVTLVIRDRRKLSFRGLFHWNPGGSEVKASASNVGDLGSIPGSGRSPGEGNGNPLQYSCLENPTDRGAW